jgi:hypothetical protein
MSIGPTFAANGPTSTILQINMTIRGGGKEVVFTLYQRFANVLTLNHMTDLVMQFMNFSKLSQIPD